MDGKTTRDNSHGSIRTYTAGFVLSVVLTLAAYLLVTHHTFGRVGLITSICTLAMLQLFVQLLFFLHLGREGRPRLNLWTMLFMVLILVIIVAGSIWIMNNLDYHMTTQRLQDLQGGGF